jgi:hypothetical protein
MDRAFRRKLLRDASALFLALICTLLVLLRVLDERRFAVAALVLVPACALIFNLLARRAWAARRIKE